MARADLFLYKAPQGEDILANDGSSFGAPTFSIISQKLRLVHSLPLSLSTKRYPNNYDEDMVQASRREEFDFKEWSIVACSADGYGNPKSVLLVHQTHLEEGYLLRFPSCEVEVCFYRGFLIEEFPGEAAVNGEDFLYSIGIKEDYSPLSETYNELSEDDEETPIIEVIRPKFSANKKHKILNLGGFAIDETPKESEEEEELEIQIDRPAFSANSKKKIQNLGSSGDRPKKQQRNEIEEDDLDEDVSFVVSPVERSAFEARNNKKPKNLDIRPKKKVEPRPAPVIDPADKEAPKFEANRKGKIPNLNQPKPRQIPKKQPEPEMKKAQEISHKEAEPAPISKPAAPIEKPAFEARKQGAIRNLHQEKEVINKTIEVEAIGETRPRRIHQEEPEPAPVLEENEWASIDVFKLKPRVYKGEQAIIASPKDPRAAQFIDAAKRNLKDLSSIRISKNCVFVPNVLPEDDPSLSSLKEFKLDDWTVLALTLDKKEEPIYCLLQKNGEDGICTLVSFKHNGPHIVMFSKKGAAVDDRALPYYDYSDLKKAVLC